MDFFDWLGRKSTLRSLGNMLIGTMVFGVALIGSIVLVSWFLSLFW